MGAIMAVGVAVANAILLVTFAEQARMDGADPSAAVKAGTSRLRPILMTSMAMLAGMVPMALGLGRRDRRPAGPGRHRRLAAATVATLLILPAVFAVVQRRTSRRSVSLDPHDPSGRFFPADSPRNAHSLDDEPTRSC